MELWRRLILLVSVCAAIWMAKYADLSSVILIKTVDFKELQSKEGKYIGKRMPISEEKQRLLDMPLTEYTDEKTGGRLFQGKNREWEEILQALTTLEEDDRLSKKRSKQKIGKEWSKRLPSDKYPSSYLFFKPDEPPVNFFKDYFKQKHDEIYVSIKEGNKTSYLKLQYRTYSDDNFHFGGGFSNPPNPPTYMLFPYRQYGLYIAMLGLLIYIFIPRQKKHPNAIRYPAWRIVIGDIVAFLMSVPFWAAPFFIVGGSIQVFTVGLPFLFMFWPISFLGIWLMTISAWFASFSLVIMNDRLQISTHKGEREFSYKDMEYFQPIVFKPPKWLIILTWTAALSGRGSAGRALILSSSEHGSLGIRFKNGSDMFISVSDALGTIMLKEFSKIIETLKNAGVQEKKEVREIRSMGLETARLPDV